MSYNDIEYGSSNLYYHKPEDVYKPYSLSSDYKLYDDDPIPFKSRKNRPTYHRYRHRNHVGNIYRRDDDKFPKAHKRKHFKTSRHMNVGRPERNMVAFGPPIKPGITSTFIITIIIY